MMRAISLLELWETEEARFPLLLVLLLTAESLSGNTKSNSSLSEANELSQQSVRGVVKVIHTHHEKCGCQLLFGLTRLKLIG